MSVQYPRRTREQAEAAAIRRVKKRAKKFPLFAHAGLLEQVDGPAKTADDFLREEKAFRDRMAAEFWKWRAGARELRAQVAALVTPEELARLDRQRRVYPRDDAYAADFWRTQLKRLEKAKQEYLMPYVHRWEEPDLVLEAVCETGELRIYQAYDENQESALDHFFTVEDVNGPGDLYDMEENGKQYDMRELPGYQAGWTIAMATAPTPVRDWLLSLIENGAITPQWDTITHPQGRATKTAEIP